jgi:hypothetical protein
MKKFLAFALVAFVMSTSAFAQMGGDKSKRPSPPATEKETVNGKTITIDYSQPSVKGRNVWAGDLAPYGKVWRTGANEATVFETSGDLMVEGKTLPAGKYNLYSIPGEKEWTIIFNEYDPKAWGAYEYKEAKDVLRVKAPAKKAKSMTEKFTIDVQPKGTVAMMWADAEVAFKVK